MFLPEGTKWWLSLMALELKGEITIKLRRVRVVEEVVGAKGLVGMLDGKGV